MNGSKIPSKIKVDYSISPLINSKSSCMKMNSQISEDKKYNSSSNCVKMAKSHPMEHPNNKNNKRNHKDNKLTPKHKNHHKSHNRQFKLNKFPKMTLQSNPQMKTSKQENLPKNCDYHHHYNLFKTDNHELKRLQLLIR